MDEREGRTKGEEGKGGEREIGMEGKGWEVGGIAPCFLRGDTG